MKRIAIVTILSANFGNRLQNYAMQEILTSLGYEVETIQKGKKNNNLSRYMKYQIKRLLRKNDWKFREFDRRIKWSPYSLSIPDEKKEMAEAYDYFIAGSDQVWNPNFRGTNENSFLSFAPEKKRIAYAASFGVDEIPDELLGKYEDYLRGFSAISVREKQAVKIIEQFNGCHAECVLDPTLLLPRASWEQLAVRPKMKGKYVLKYLLGEDQTECNKLIKELCDGITIIDIKKHLSGEEKPIDPAEFLGLILNAELVCTDSFHASVFSTIFAKPYVIFERMDAERNMSSRLDTLCDTLNLRDHRYCLPEFIIEKVMTPDYERTLKILEQERKKSLNFLQKALND